MDPIPQSLRQYLPPLTLSRNAICYMVMLLLFFFLIFIRYNSTRLPLFIIVLCLDYCFKKLELLAQPVPDPEAGQPVQGQETRDRPERRIKKVLLVTYGTDVNRYCNDGCVICLEEFQQGESLRVLASCNHMFHPKCIAQWLTRKNKNCPICRKSIDLNATTVNDGVTLLDVMFP